MKVPPQHNDGPISDRAAERIEKILSTPVEIESDEDYQCLGSLVEDESEESLALEE